MRSRPTHTRRSSSSRSSRASSSVSESERRTSERRATTQLPRSLSRRCVVSHRPTRICFRPCARRCARTAPSARFAASSASFGVHMTRMRSRTWIALGLALVPAAAIPLAAVAMSGGTPSFTREVAPIIAEKCAGCHQAGGIAPFPLATSEQISSRAALIGAAVQARVMPPWPPGRRSPAYVGQAARTLTAQQRATLVAWATKGGKVDGPARKPARPERAEVRAGERLLNLRMQSAYKPSAPKGVTDDYRCFLLDPEQSSDGSVTSVRIEPGQSRVVHHVILFRVASAQVAAAKGLDRASSGTGWSCFGGTGLPAGDTGAGIADSLNNANWIAAWAPGWGGSRLPAGTGVALPAGNQIVMQVHYNLLNGNAPDRSRALLTVAP